MDDSLAFRQINIETLKLAIKINDTVTQAETHWDLADFFRDKAVPDSAFYHFGEAQKLYNGLKDNYMSARMLYNMAVVQSDIKDYTGGEIKTIRAIELLKPLKSNEQLYDSYNLLANISTELREYNRALEYYQIALEYLKDIEGSINLEQVTQNNIGIVYQEQGEHKKAIPYFVDVLRHEDLEQTEPSLYGKALSNLAYSKFKANDSLGVLALFKKSITIQERIGDIQGISRTYFNLADYYLKQQDTALALFNAKKSKAYAIEANNNKRLLQTLKLFPHVDPKNMYGYMQEYIALDDSLQQEERRIRDKFARIRFETDEVVANNQLLARQQQLWIAIASGLFLLTVATIIIIEQIRRNQKLKFQRKQQESNQEIFDLMLSQQGKLEEGKQLEQQRVSEELHDSILSQMLGIRLVLTGLNKKTDDESIEKRADLIKKLQGLEEEIRTISHELSSSSSKKIRNFIISLEDLLQNVTESSTIKCDFLYDSEVNWDALKGDIKINIYRIVQELLQNCVKHAKAHQVNITFALENSIFEVTMVDDGVGFDVGKAKKGIGMKNINSRVTKMGGSWSINSSVGSGTKTIITIPVDNLEINEFQNNSSLILQNV